MILSTSLLQIWSKLKYIKLKVCTNPTQQETTQDKAMYGISGLSAKTEGFYKQLWPVLLTRS